MATIELKGLAHAYDSNPLQESDFALKTLDLTLENGVAYALLGSSGCGKTTLLNLISGLLQPTHGKVLFDGHDVTFASPRDRHIAQVFQFPVVYDTMTVGENLAFPLKNRGVDRRKQAERVTEVSHALGLDHLLEQKPGTLPMGIRQLISLGRGLVREDVNAILFDEPLTVIDPQLKWQLRSRLKALHARFDMTMVYVTHDQTEALTFADKVMVMEAGRILQIGTAQSLYETPQTRFVGHFVGSPGMNFLEGTIRGDRFVIGNHAIQLHKTYDAGQSSDIALGIRPEFVQFCGPSIGLPVELLTVQNLGRRLIVSVSLEGQDVKLSLPRGAPIPSDKLRILPDITHAAIYADGHRLPR